MQPFTAWASIASHLKFEAIQAAYEGRPVPAPLAEEVDRLDERADLFDDRRAREILAELAALPVDPAFPYDQPDDLEAIRRLRPDGPRRMELDRSDDAMLERFHGAWTGRACGCALGKPVEAFSLIDRGRLRIRDYLERRGHWPLDFYFSAEPRDDDEPGRTIDPDDPAARENIAYMPPDDDIHYTLVALRVLERHGPGFAWHDVAETWNQMLPFASLCTAEAQAMTNYNLRNVRGEAGPRPSPHWTARHNNPYREWIGAQIRADGWAYAAAGDPEFAAELAWRDARWTHTANGIYGEMFTAAMIAAAFAPQGPDADPARLVHIGLSEIPANCRLAEAVRLALKWVEQCDDLDGFMTRLEDAFGDLHPVHTVNNAMICVAARCFGQRDGDADGAAAICHAVAAGLDTDCNGATVGSIVGATIGHARFSDRLKKPLNDTIRPNVLGFEKVRIADLARRTLAVHKAARRAREST